MISPVWAQKRTLLVDLCLSDDDTPARDQERALAEEAFRDLRSFVVQCWHILDPTAPVEWGWHLDTICRELMKVTTGETRDLLICMPPGFGKSLIVSVLWPAWWWLRDPSKRYVTVSGGEDLAIKDNRRMREIITSDWYQRLVKHAEAAHGVKAWTFAKDQNRKRYYENSARGHRQAFGLDGQLTGNRGDGIIVDDPHQVRDTLGDPDKVEIRLGDAWHRTSGILATRVFNKRLSWTVTIMQRIHEKDVAGRKIARSKTKRGRALRCVILPMRFDPARLDIHEDDPRTEAGELLAPNWIGPIEVDELVQELDEIPGQASAQLDQRPIPAKGGLFKTAYLSHRYNFDPQRPETRFPLVITTIDATFKKTIKGSFVSISAWGIRGVERYLLGEIHERMDYVELKQRTRDFHMMFLPNFTLIEEKANGAALCRDLGEELQGLIAVNMDTYGDKMTRAQLSLPAWAAGNVFLPESEWMPTIGEWIAEVMMFPFGPNDRVDGMSQLFLWLADNHSVYLTEKQLADRVTAAFNAW